MHSGSSKSLRMNPTLRKALGSTFSIFPGVGKEVMGKMLNCKAHLSIAKSSVKEAHSRMEKDSATFDIGETHDRGILYCGVC